MLERTAEVKRKSYRESLEQNRDAVLLSKELVTIDSHVPLPLDLAAMETQPPDVEACRELFTELEFTSMLRELGAIRRRSSRRAVRRASGEQSAAFYSAARQHGFAFALDAAEPSEPEPDDQQPQTLSLLDAVEAAEKKTLFSIGVCADPAIGLQVPLTSEVRALLEDPSIPKRVHDWKLALHVLSGLDVSLRGAIDDTMLLSYALNPTHATQALADVAARHGQSPPSTLPAGAAAIHALVPSLRAYWHLFVEAKKLAYARPGSVLRRSRLRQTADGGTDLDALCRPTPQADRHGQGPHRSK